tara:strand:- start:134 stop:328 length:195 start_codon:yes stop_codon:yes gene_type:complete
MSRTEYVKQLLDTDIEVCKHTTKIYDLRKIIAFLKAENNIIYSENCECGLSKRKHKSYVKDWAI